MKFLPIHICSAMMLATFAAHAETRISATGTEVELCNVDGIKVLHSGNGYSVESFATRNTTPSIVVSLNGKECYFDLVAGEGAGFNVKYNGVTYHTQRPRYVPTFFFTPETSDTEYGFTVTATGTYDIDWGDGTIQTIEKTTTTAQTIDHTFPYAANEFEIKLGGRATAYSSDAHTAAISFNATASHLSEMHGCLGCIFSTLADGSQPRFYFTFADNSNLTGTIPEELFSGLTGNAVRNMFDSLFHNCTGLTGDIPGDLFGTVHGTAIALFSQTFSNCTGLSGDIPENLFSNIVGNTNSTMFYRTFYKCNGLTGIPSKLFSGINTNGAYATDVFKQTFSQCTKLTGPSAKIGDKYLYDIWPNATNQQTYYNDTKLSDYTTMSAEWK